MTPVLAERERLWQIEQLSRAHGPFRLMVIRPYATKTGFYRSEWLPGEVTKEDVIAAAPDLLDALKQLLIAYESLLPGVRYLALQDYAILNTAPINASLAIAKAEGRG